MYELDHPHVMKFREWYETTNHLWLVMDLCDGIRGRKNQNLIIVIVFFLKVVHLNQLYKQMDLYRKHRYGLLVLIYVKVYIIFINKILFFVILIRIKYKRIFRL